jgi:hypothetical protein
MTVPERSVEAIVIVVVPAVAGLVGATTPRSSAVPQGWSPLGHRETHQQVKAPRVG